MMELKNNVDKEAIFDSLEAAKQYYLHTECDSDEEKQRNADILNANTLEELADVLNQYSDTCDNGAEFFTREI